MTYSFTGIGEFHTLQELLSGLSGATVTILSPSCRASDPCIPRANWTDIFQQYFSSYTGGIAQLMGVNIHKNQFKRKNIASARSFFFIPASLEDLLPSDTWQAQKLTCKSNFELGDIWRFPENGKIDGL